MSGWGKEEQGRQEEGEAGFYHKELISHNSILIYESKGSIGKKKNKGMGRS